MTYYVYEIQEPHGPLIQILATKDLGKAKRLKHYLDMTFSKRRIHYAFVVRKEQAK